ncbi:MAG: RHS repeat-associated core domain-containing protein [Bacteroidota bacterium]
MFIHHYSTATRYEQVYGVITDRQGSIMALYNTHGNIVYETTYDAWGRERNPISADYTATTTRPIWIIRGYTGHEHLTEFGLINMNGRMYDPQIGRMLSPDNFVQSADATQAYNRYTYALNNPLRYKDPSGELYLLDDILVFTGGFVMGYVGYGITTGDWGGKALVAGLGVGAIAELSYATLGVGSFAAGSLGTAGQFGASFAAGYGGAVIGNREQIKAASENGSWNGVLLSIGYGAVAGLSSGIGMNSYLSSNETNLLGKGVNEAKVFSNMARGLNTLLEKGYDADTRQWSLSGKDWRDVGVDLVAGFGSSYLGEGTKLWYDDKIGKSIYEKNLFGAFTKNMSYGAIKLSTGSWNIPQERDKIIRNIFLKTITEGYIEGKEDVYAIYQEERSAFFSFYDINPPKLRMQEHIYLLNIFKH